MRYAPRTVFDETNYRVVATLLNWVLAFVPIALIAVKQTTTIKASMTAYSTAVGPSSETRNRFTLVVNPFIEVCLSVDISMDFYVLDLRQVSLKNAMDLPSVTEKDVEKSIFPRSFSSTRRNGRNLDWGRNPCTCRVIGQSLTDPLTKT
jgi:hypothetical protein